MLKFFSCIFVLTGSHFSFHCLKMKRIRVFSRSGLNNNAMVMLAMNGTVYCFVNQNQF